MYESYINTYNYYSSKFYTRVLNKIKFKQSDPKK